MRHLQALSLFELGFYLYSYRWLFFECMLVLFIQLNSIKINSSSFLFNLHWYCWGHRQLLALLWIIPFQISQDPPPLWCEAKGGLSFISIIIGAYLYGSALNSGTCPWSELGYPHMAFYMSLGWKLLQQLLWSLDFGIFQLLLLL